MKTDKLRRNVDISRKAVLILQWKAIGAGHGTIKPYLEHHLEDHAKRILVRHPELKKILKQTKR
ncbi:MAG TPA: hypothetical protein VL443_05500 [Cyclobacteriaceae bacterium]|jgi:hypothetical protein|nr:hypothetical protein [Cyclobacteriaceae bacterium]